MKENINILKNLSNEEKKIFNSLQTNGPITKSEISRLTEIKLTTLKCTMDLLEKKRIIVREAIGQSTGGRKPVLYDVNLLEFYIIGIDISRVHTQVIITNLKMKILHKEMFYMDVSCSPEETVRRIYGIINKANSSLKLASRNLVGIGLGTVGPLDIKNGTMMSPVNFSALGWSNVPIREMLEKKLKSPIIIENGVNAAVIGEYFYGIGKGVENIAYLNCGIGIRTGTVLSGTLMRTISDEEDGLGHMIVNIHGEKCKCGNLGCIEGYSSINAIIKKFSLEVKKGRNTIINKQLENIEYKDICIAAERNDNLSKEVLIGAALILGTGLVNYINLLNPGLVILSGPLIINSKLFYNECIKTVLKRLHPDRMKKIIFSRGGFFKENAISLGAVALVIKDIYN
ncbi:ROK family protein [Clostridium estertheticum]|uniref:ROK family protein n=1 Tax=Clostridium estertheticum TaxID=238834 RepID=UPI001C0D1035|nr:ROK family protein [Clostridium estertheticum]MBU3177690.1 ROK family protein [Clostridium estertheticum]